jgi:hypothetical protein
LIYIILAGFHCETSRFEVDLDAVHMGIAIENRARVKEYNATRT